MGSTQLSPASTPAGNRPGWRRRLWIWVRRAAASGALSVLLFAGLVVVGLIPVNNDFRPTPDGVEVLFISNDVHADVLVPIRTDVVDWSEVFPPGAVSADVSRATHVAIGWGDKGFYIGTPTWADLRLSKVGNALFLPSSTCLHVMYADAELYRAGGRSVRISREQYARLAEYIRSSIRPGPDGRAMAIPGAAYGFDDAFFEARGSYHVFNTCNCWIGRGMQAAGIRTGLFTPLPRTVLWWLP